MSILDDAIRQHLELKRAHGADDSELKRLEDEAFGPPQRPDEADPFAAEPPTEFLVSPGETPAAVPEIEDDTERSGRRPDIADLQEAPPASSGPPAGAPPAPPQEELAPLPDAPPPSPADAADVPLPPPADELPPPSVTGDEAASAPSAEASPPPSTDAASAPSDDAASSAESPPAPAGEATTPEPDGADERPTGVSEIAASGPDTEDRRAIADQPTQMFDVQAHVDADATEAPAAPEENVPAPEAEEDAGPAASGEPGQEPLDIRGPDAEVAGHPPAESAPTEEESAEFDFFNEQRLSDELDQALEAPLPPTDEHIAMPRYEDAPSGQTGIFDFETEDRYEEDPSEEVLRRHDAPSPAAEEPSREAPEATSEELEPPSQEYDSPAEEAPRAAAEPDSEEVDAYDPDTGHEDVLEDTPTFLEDAPEDDDLWFEQKPPKDFDL